MTVERINFLNSVDVQSFLHGNPAHSGAVIYYYFFIDICQSFFEDNHELQIAMFEILISKPEKSNIDHYRMSNTDKTRLLVLFDTLFKGWEKTNNSPPFSAEKSLLV